MPDGAATPPDPDEAAASRSVVDRAVAAIDEANRQDPVSIEFGGEQRPKELVHSERMTHWVRVLDPEAGDAQLIAARAHHLRRWVVPRSSYPEGRSGYLKWRVDQKKRQVEELTDILVSVGCPPDVIDRASTIVAKKGLSTDPAVQTHEDALCLVFLELQVDELAAKLERRHMVDVLRKSLAKMSSQGIDAAAAIPMSDEARELLSEAVAALST